MDTPSSSPETTAQPAPASLETRKHSYGGLIGILLIVGVIVFGAFYVWGERIALEEAASEPVSF